MVDPDDDVEELGPYTSCGACGGNGCDRCMPHLYEDEEESDG